MQSTPTSAAGICAVAELSVVTRHLVGNMLTSAIGTTDVIRTWIAIIGTRGSRGIESNVEATTSAVAHVLIHTGRTRITAGRAGQLVVGTAGSGPVAAIRAVTRRIGWITAGRIAWNKAIVGTGSGAGTGILDRAFRPRITTICSGGCMVAGTNAAAIAGIRVGTRRIAGIATAGTQRCESFVGASTTAITGILIDTGRTGITARCTVRLEVVATTARAIAAIRVVTCGVDLTAAGGPDRAEATIGALAEAITAIRQDTFIARIPAGRAICSVIALATPGSITGIGIRARGIADVAAECTRGDIPVVDAGAVAIALVLNRAVVPCITTI